MVEDAPAKLTGRKGIDLLDATPLIVVATLSLVTMWCMHLHGLGYEGGAITTVFVAAAAIWSFGRVVRFRQGDLVLARVAETVGLMLALSLLASVASAALTPASGPLIDSALAEADRILLPWFDWPGMLAFLARHPWTLEGLSYVYVSLNWQPLLLLAVAGMTRRPDMLRRFVAVWALAVAFCILPFHWLPAIGPYPYYGVGPEAVPGHLVALPFVSPSIFLGLQDGTLDTIGRETISGLVCFPSFHACAAVLLGWAFSAWPRLRLPMRALNAAMFVAAIPIGGHYVVDVIAGGIAAMLAIAGAGFIAQYKTASDPRRRGVQASAIF